MMIGSKVKADTGEYMNNSLATVRKADAIVAALETQIVNGTRGPGARLDERVLA